jgi:hypothetical protein
VTDAFGVNEKLAELIAQRAGVDVMHSLDAREACQCWDPQRRVSSCGAACAARTAERVASTT